MAYEITTCSASVLTSMIIQNVEGMGLYPEPLNLTKNKDIRLKSPIDRLRQDILGSGP